MADESGAATSDGIADTLLAMLEQADEAATAAEERTPEAEREAMEAVREQAVEFGTNPKSAGEHGLAGCIRRKWERFLERHGACASL